MGRLKIEMPSQQLASVTIPVRISDINYGNHVGNDAFVSIIHEARLQWLIKNNYTELNFAGTSLIMSEIAIEFKNESFYGDTINITIYVGEISRVSFELFYTLSTQRDSMDFLLANAKTGMVCYNYETKKTVSIPDEIKKLISTS